VAEATYRAAVARWLSHCHRGAQRAGPLRRSKVSAPSGHFWRQFMDQLRPFVLYQLSHIVGDFREAFRLEQELVQPLEIFPHHNMIGDNPRCVDALGFQL
jgi:hypothetical protein